MTTIDALLEAEDQPDPPAVVGERPPRWHKIAAAIFVIATLGFIAFVGYWAVDGGRWYVVKTPSMGTSAPVGTLLWVEPVKASQLHVGEFITFHPPNSSQTYSHRIFAIDPDGGIHTKGQITAEDPWTIHPANIVGRVSMRWWGIGWLVRAAPILIIGGLIVGFAATRLARNRWRVPVAVLGSALVLCIAIVVLQPFTRAVQLAAAPVHNGGKVTYVSTGLLPLRVGAPLDGHVDLRAGEVGSIVSHHLDTHGKYPISLKPHISIWFWILMIVSCFLPALWTTVFGQRPARAPRHRAAAD
jgi:hypothetical protein